MAYNATGSEPSHLAFARIELASNHSAIDVDLGNSLVAYDPARREIKQASLWKAAGFPPVCLGSYEKYT
jgi:hypothetical protein